MEPVSNQERKIMPSTPEEFNKMLNDLYGKATGSPTPQGNTSPIVEPSAQAIIAANALRDQFLAFLRVGFTEDQALAILLTALAHAGHQ
jgi:hypothetical protein